MTRRNAIAIILLAVGLTSQVATGQETKLTKYDQLKVAIQKICPVTGKPLGSMGDPLKVKIGEEEIFLCCKGCTKGQINKEHWTAIHKNFARAQGICPVMEKKLPANPKSTVVNGQTVYICCPPCTKKIQAEPRKYLTKLAGYYQTSLQKISLRNPSDKSAQNLGLQTPNSSSNDAISKALASLSHKDRLHASVQAICPVSGNALGAMGTPMKVRVGKMDVFLCCEGCNQENSNEQHWSKIAANVKSKQAKCPVMEKQLPANAKSTIVDGQLVFVCCPPCTKKIEAEREKYLAKVDGYLLSSLKSLTSRR